MIEAQHVVALAFNALAADSQFSTAVGGRIYRDQVPQAAALPAAIVGPIVSAVDSLTLGGDRVFAVVELDVHLVAAGPSYGPINAAGDRADAVLSHLGGPAGGADVVELRRSAVRAYLENEAGTTYAHIVQTYRSEAYAL